MLLTLYTTENSSYEHVVVAYILTRFRELIPILPVMYSKLAVLHKYIDEIVTKTKSYMDDSFFNANLVCRSTSNYISMSKLSLSFSVSCNRERLRRHHKWGKLIYVYHFSWLSMGVEHWLKTENEDRKKWGWMGECDDRLNVKNVRNIVAKHHPTMNSLIHWIVNSTFPAAGKCHALFC